MSAQLVQIAVNAAYFNEGNKIPQAVYGERPKEITDLVDALSRMFTRIGMNVVCGACFEGELPHQKWGHSTNKGCCGGCPILGHSRCMAKPLMCAGWMCGFTRGLYPNTSRFLYDVQRYLPGDSGPYMQGVLREQTLQLSEAQKRVYRVMRHAVDAWK